MEEKKLSLPEIHAELIEQLRDVIAVGGFGSAVCEVIAETGANCRVHRIGMEDVYSTIVGTQQYLRGEYKMDDKAICERTIGWLND